MARSKSLTDFSENYSSSTSSLFKLTLNQNVPGKGATKEKITGADLELQKGYFAMPVFTEEETNNLQKLTHTQRLIPTCDVQYSPLPVPEKKNLFQESFIAKSRDYEKPNNTRRRLEREIPRSRNSKK